MGFVALPGTSWDAFAVKHAIIGRDDELQTALGALEANRPVLLEGPAGIGKTALWASVVTQAQGRGWRVLSCAPAESESLLPYAALADLLTPLSERVDALSPPQRAAAQVVLLSEHSDEPVDERSVAAATRSLLASVMDDDRAPVLLAVDDAQWLDGPSARVIAFAVRRSNLVRVLATQRAGSADVGAPLGLDRLSGVEVEKILVAPLGVGALHHVLRARLGTTVHRPLLARIVREAGGNPLLTIGLTQAVLRLPRLPLATDDLPVAGGSLQQLVEDLFAALPPRTRRAVRLASLLSVPRLADLRAAGVHAAELDRAEESRLVSVTPEQVVFAHPVYAAAVRSSIPVGVRRQMHRELADAVTDPDERARHLVSCAPEPDSAIAAELSEAARRQHVRGAPESAAGLYEHAAALTPASQGDERAERSLAAAQCWFAGGSYSAAARLAGELAAASTGATRAEALLLLAAVAFNSDDASLGSAAEIAEEALLAAGDLRVLAGRVHAHLALFHDAPDVARRHASVAVATLSQASSKASADCELLSSALMLQLYQEVRAGLPPRPHLLEQGLALEGDRPSWLAGTVPAIWWSGIDEHDLARQRLDDMLGWATSRGDEAWEHEVVCHLAEIELLAGRFDAAGRHIAAALQLGEQLGSGLVSERWLAGMLHAHRGELDDARAIAEAGLRTAEKSGSTWCRRIHLHLTGFVALSAGQMSEAATAYAAVAEASDALGLVESLAVRFEPDWIEACVATGDLDSAAAALERLAGRHQRLPRPWTALGLARGRVLLASARGSDPTAELDALEAALRAAPPSAVPLARARCLLAAGMAHRRARRKRLARQALTGALDAFLALGAAAFAVRASEEIARIGGRPPAPLGLTATEERVAQLAAEGRTNRVIADNLFLSPKTVEANLARVYRKLGIATRAELGVRMAARNESQ